MLPTSFPFGSSYRSQVGFKGEFVSESIKSRIRELYTFLREANQLRFPPVRQIKEQPKVVRLADLPLHPSMQLTRPVRIDDVQEVPDVLLRVRRPAITRCPHPPSQIESWLLPGWDDPGKPEAHSESLNSVDEQGETITIRFDDDEERVVAFAVWKSLREKWVTPENLARQALRMFEVFYDIHSTLEKDGEQLELLAADGFLSWRTESATVGIVNIEHPLLLKRVELRFDPNVPEFTIHETDREPELYGSLFVDLKATNPTAIRARNTELEAGGYHPLGWEDTEGFLRALIQSISPINGEFLEKPSFETLSETPRLWRDPVLLLRKRIAGLANSVDAIIDDIEKQTFFPPALAQITGTIEEWEGSGLGSLSFESGKLSQGAPLSEENILLAKEANEAQIQIISRLDSSGSVIVQGPPGTGKTHTIGNLIGHLLSQGKSILVTAQTAKALRVLRDKVPPMLQPLCVAMLGSDQEARKQLESSIESITERLTSDNAQSLLGKAAKYEAERRELLHKAKSLSHKLREALENEYKEISVNGRVFSPSEAARFVAQHCEAHSWIPGSVTLGVNIPISDQEITRLYALGTSFSQTEELDTRHRLPELSSLPTETQFKVMCTEYRALTSSNLEYGKERWDNGTRLSSEIEDLAKQVELEFSDELKTQAWRPHAIVAGINGGTERLVWERLIEGIEQAVEANGQYALMMHHRPKLADTIPIHKQCQISVEISEHLDAGGKIGFLQLATHGEWRQFIKSVSVTAGQPSHRDHFEAVTLLARLEAARLDLADLWDSLVGQHVGTPFLNMGTAPELSCRALIPEIKRCMEWHAATWCPLVLKLNASGLKYSDVQASVPRETSPVAEYIQIERVASSVLPGLLAMEASRRKLKECERGFDELANLSAKVDPSAPNKGAIARIIQSVRTRNADAYAAALEYTRRLHAVKPLVAERDALLTKLGLVAPRWSELIFQRISPHDNAQVPGDIGQAWVWRQLYETLAERDQLDADELQREIEKTRAILRQVTESLIDAKAWGKQLERLQGQHSIRQALVGWLDTAKRLISTRQVDKRQLLLSEARRLMKQCSGAVPVWIMPISLMAESFDPRATRFDVVIIDEASQADLNALIPLYMGKQVVVVGDHEQVTPLGIGKEQTILENLRKSILHNIPNSHLFDNMASIYDIGRQAFGDAIRLTEHFRCVPEIIAFSNQLSYEGKIRPLRESNSTQIKPACVPYRVKGLRQNDVNVAEAEAIVGYIKAMIEHPIYAGKTIGVISLLKENQAILIQSMIHKEIDAVNIAKRRIQAGISAEFQGDERDIIFLSMVDSSAEEGTLRTTGEGAFELVKKRYNVAASRAKDQLWVMHSFDPNLHLKTNDLRFRLLQHMKDPMAALRAYNQEVGKTESPFEREVLKRLSDAGYRVKSQWQVGYFRIDMVVEGGGKRLAVECDGDRYHPLEKLGEDMERQAILERLGWQFLRIRGSAFYRDPEQAMKPLFARLAELEISPEGVAEEESATDMTLIHELKELILLAHPADSFSSEKQSASDGAVCSDTKPDGFLLEPNQLQVTGDKVLIELILNEMDGGGSLDEFRERYKTSKGFERMGKNIRLSLERDLAELTGSGKIIIDHDRIKLGKKTPDQQISSSRQNSAHGAVFGALAGDAAGATLEFLQRKPTPQEVEIAMQMVGGGVWKTAPGQVTDDGELTLALAHALAGQSTYDPRRSAHFYRKWYLSNPFDVGYATTNALGSGDLNSETLFETVLNNALKMNSESKANGSLMRASVLGVWSATVSVEDAIKAARLDAQLTHPNPACQWAGVAYVLAIRHLLLQPGDAAGAFDAAKAALQNDEAEEVRGWLQDAHQEILPACHPSAGYIRIAFTHAFYHLLKQSSYPIAIAETLSGGGDTDTNACIVGGLLGALHGSSGIPEVMKSAVNSCDTKLGRPRPPWLQTSQMESVIVGLG
jgi:ADP-ribosylglycohydrolase/very-short-patch-repair endonuclease